jgi:hypothetical protein
MEPIARSTSQCLQLLLAHKGIQGHESRLSLPVPLFPCNISCNTRSFAWCAIYTCSRGNRVARCPLPHYFGCLRRLMLALCTGVLCCRCCSSRSASVSMLWCYSVACSFHFDIYSCYLASMENEVLVIVLLSVSSQDQ